MKILVGIAFYIFAIATMAGSVLFWYRDSSSETKTKALIISEILLHIGLIIILIHWIRNQTF